MTIYRRMWLVAALTALGLGAVVLPSAAAPTWTSAGSMSISRVEHLATLLADGRVLVTGGQSTASGNGGYDTKLAEIYDPTTNSWSATGSTTNGRTETVASRLADGRVLVAGGEGPNPFPSVASAEIYNPATGTWTATGSMALTRCCNTDSFLTLLADGRVMAAGGASGFANFATANGPAVEIYDPATGVWTPTGSMSVGRQGGTFSLLGNGKVLAAGGYDGTAYQSNAELWDPATGTWSSTASLAGPRGAHTATVLSNGKVLVVGGVDSGGYLSSAELFNSLGSGFDFTGFFSPVDNPPAFNVAKAGSGIPVKFSLNGNQGLDIFEPGYPRSERIACDASASLDDIEQTVAAGGSSLSYDATSDRYTYVWKTDKAWAHTCRKLTIRLSDGSDHFAYSKFVK
jgi:hypothetical protein